LNCDAGIKVDGYPSALYQIVSNLVTNSIVHAFHDGQSGEMRLNVSQRDDVLLMTYRDNGEGVTDEVCEHIFEPFYTTSRATGSTGLGMHIVFNLVTQMGGSIEVENHEGEGVTFQIELPVTFPTEVGVMAG
jgi:signal transduction histidine kinase